jgi:hypothetical protein
MGHLNVLLLLEKYPSVNLLSGGRARDLAPWSPPSRP